MSIRCRNTWLLALVLALAVPLRSGAQQYSSGQPVVPVFEGWEQNPDGTVYIHFGYLNRNFEEEADIPVGPNNSIEPGGPDQGQPTHFYTRRQRFTFKIKVPKDFGKNELVWTLTVNGKTEKAYGTMMPVEIIDREAIVKNRTGGGSEQPDNQPPTIELQGPKERTATVGEPLTLTAVAKDDGIPKTRPAGTSRPPGRTNALGLRLNWMQYRGPANGSVQFDPYLAPGMDHFPPYVPPALPADGKVVTTARFSEPGTYVVRGTADDGYLYDFVDVTVTVRPKPSGSAQR